MTDERLKLGDAIRFLRLKRGISARSLSLSAGLSSSYVGKLEAGEIEPSVRAFGSIALALSMTSAEVMFCVFAEHQTN